MFDFQHIIFPALIGVFGGLLGPMLVEKWKGGREEVKKNMLMEAEIEKLQGTFTEFSARLEERVSSIESQVKAIEINMSHNTGVLKSRLPNAPLEQGGTNEQKERL